MKPHNLQINGLPALQVGPPSDQVFLYVHGKMDRKEDAIAFAMDCDP